MQVPHPARFLACALPIVCCSNLPVAAAQHAEGTTAPALEEHDPRHHEHSRAGMVAPREWVPTWLAELQNARRRWEQAGYRLDFFLTVDASWHAIGGASTGSGAVRELLDAILTIDSQTAFGYPGGTWDVGLQGIAGDDGSRDAGVLQKYSNIDEPDDRLQVHRFSYRHVWHDGETEARIGKMDANEQFAATKPGREFIHSAMGYSPTILGFPTYPNPAFGATLHQHVGSSTNFAIGIFDGAGAAGIDTGLHGLGTTLHAPDDAFAIAQVNYAWGAKDDPSGRVGVGLWHHSGEFQRFSGGPSNGTAGLFSMFEQRFWMQGRLYEGFAQLGTADDEVSPIGAHVGLGVTTRGLLLPDEREDAAGIGLSFAKTSSAGGAEFSASAETAVETFYGWKCAPGMRVEPHLHYVMDPGGDSSRSDAWIATVRISFAF